MTSNDAVELDQLLNETKDVLVEYVNQCQQEGVSVIDPHSPQELEKIFDFELTEKGVGPEGILDTIQGMLRYSVRSWNNRFIDKLYSGTDPIGVISELILGVLNSNNHVYHVSPVTTMMEIKTSRKMAEFIGFKDGSGITCPGGSASNQLAVITARNRKFPHIKREGFRRGEVLTMFTSAHSHYSFEKAAIMMGIGTDHLISVPCTDHGTMIPEELEKCIQQSISRGESPFFVNGTAGTTVLGAFDPLRAIGAICQKYGLWFHVDGSWGGSVMFSNKLRHLIDGSELADSYTINPHKMLGIPLQCSYLLTKDPHVLQKFNALNAEYLFHGEHYDLGDGTVGCGRRPDAVKMFLAWKYRGAKGFEIRVDRGFDLAQYMYHKLSEHPRFRLVAKPVNLNVCFWYIPESLDLSLEKINAEVFGNHLAQVTKEIHAYMRRSGRFMFDYAPLHHPEPLPIFFRIITHPRLTFDEVDELVKTIAEVGEKIFPNYEEFDEDSESVQSR
ncbi:PLP-dependent transferase [Basidiobolus meristosporus CBS 931.73]|uniref:PLP-dependent transferase n=1 Tax=Basidiobolus meristosporus CBS 931.73 TaxID=1314790 RepID=A0A1Y1XQX8_9FUNG|nr:PLP-dependent transferase [Basidiobolus meristosporus CBS 931.73]|eukprot:ORX88179.1 PLP-dependent transferase [Basidiobolus meristosporus CBS 931.73]